MPHSENQESPSAKRGQYNKPLFREETKIDTIRRLIIDEGYTPHETEDIEYSKADVSALFIGGIFARKISLIQKTDRRRSSKSISLFESRISRLTTDFPRFVPMTKSHRWQDQEYVALKTAGK